MNPIIPSNKDAMREQLLLAISLDPSAETAASMVMAYIGLAQSDGVITGISQARDIFAQTFLRESQWSSK